MISYCPSASSEVETLAAYVRALGGKLKIIADSGEKSYVLGWPNLLA